MGGSKYSIFRIPFYLQRTPRIVDPPVFSRSIPRFFSLVPPSGSPPSLPRPPPDNYPSNLRSPLVISLLFCPRSFPFSERNIFPNLGTPSGEPEPPIEPLLFIRASSPLFELPPPTPLENSWPDSLPTVFISPGKSDRITFCFYTCAPLPVREQLLGF